MTFQFERVGRRVGAMGTLIWSLSSMASNVTLQLAQLDTCIIAFRTLVWFFVSMSITNVANEFSRGCKSRFAELTEMRFGSRVSVHVIRETSDGFETALADATLMRTKRI